MYWLNSQYLWNERLNHITQVTRCSQTYCPCFKIYMQDLYIEKTTKWNIIKTQNIPTSKIHLSLYGSKGILKKGKHFSLDIQIPPKVWCLIGMFFRVLTWHLLSFGGLGVLGFIGPSELGERPGTNGWPTFQRPRLTRTNFRPPEDTATSGRDGKPRRMDWIFVSGSRQKDGTKTPGLLWKHQQQK